MVILAAERVDEWVVGDSGRVGGGGASFVARAPFNYKLTALIRKLASSSSLVFSRQPTTRPRCGSIITADAAQARRIRDRIVHRHLIGRTCQLILLKRRPPSHRREELWRAFARSPLDPVIST